MDHAAAKHGAVAVKLGNGAGHAQGFEQTPPRIFKHGIAPDFGVFAFRKRARHDVGQYVAGRAAIFELLAGVGFQWSRFGIAGDIFAAIQKQHSRRIGIENLDLTFRHFGVVEAGRHMQQMAQGNRSPSVARGLPFRNRCRFIEREPSVCNHKAHESGGDAFRHGSADQPRVGTIARRITFGDDPSALHDNQGPCLGQRGIFKKGCNRRRKTFLADHGVIDNVGFTGSGSYFRSWLLGTGTQGD